MSTSMLIWCNGSASEVSSPGCQFNDWWCHQDDRCQTGAFKMINVEVAQRLARVKCQVEVDGSIPMSPINIFLSNQQGNESDEREGRMRVMNEYDERVRRMKTTNESDE